MGQQIGTVVVTLQIRIDVPLMRLGEFHMVCASKSKRWVALVVERGETSPIGYIAGGS